MNLRQKLEFLMARKDITKAQLSKDLDIPYTTIDSILKRDTFENVKFSMLKKLCDYFNVDMRYLCYDEIIDADYGKKADTLPQNDLASGEQELLTDYRNLTPNGQEKTKEYVKDLLSNPKYIRVPTTDFKTLRQTAESIIAAFDAKNQRMPTKK